MRSLICLLKHFLWRLNREWIKTDAVEAGKLFSFRQKIMKIRQISRWIEVVDFRIVCEQKICQGLIID